MDPTTSGRFRVHDRRPRPDIEDGEAETGNERATEGEEGEKIEGPTEGERATPSEEPTEDEFILVELPDGPIDPTDPDAADQFDPLYATAEGYDEGSDRDDGGDGTEASLADRVADLKPGYVVEATLAWTDGSARFVDLEVVRESRFRFADDVEGMFEAAVETWDQIRAAGEAVGSITTRSNDGEPNGALYLFADAPGSDTFAEVSTARLPIEPLVARVNESRDDDEPREVFVLRPAAHEFVAVYVVFDREGVLAQTVRDTYGLGSGLAAGLEEGAFEPGETSDGPADRDSEDGSADGSGVESTDDDFDALDRL